MNRTPGRKAKSLKPKAAGKKSPPARAAGRPKDELRTFGLLWSSHERGGRSGLTVPAIVSAAVKMADQEGFEAVSMRRLADALEVGTMSLYTHVPGKAELTDLMIDAVFGEVYEDEGEPTRQPGGYRERLRFVAERNRILYTNHPWLLDVPLGRPVLGPHACVKYEGEVRVLDGIGLTPLQVNSIGALLVMHVQSTARMHEMTERAQQADGMTEREWWDATEPMLDRVISGRFPVAERIGKAAGEAMGEEPSAEHFFKFGLEVLFDAVDAMIARNKEAT